MKKIILSIAAGFTALGLGLGIFYAGDFIVSMFQSPETEMVQLVPNVSVKPKEIPIEELVYPKPVFTTQENERLEDQSENEKFEFSAQGEYYIIGNKPTDFEEIHALIITTTDYLKATAENDFDDAILPEGYIETKKEFNFTRIKIANKKISFITETKKGISYEFIGEFIEGEKITYATNYGFDQTDYAVLKGILIKKRNGKKIAESKVKLAAGGC